MINFTKEIGIFDCFVECDDAATVRALKQGCSTNALSGHLIEKIQIMFQGIRLSEFVYVRNIVSNV